VTFRHPVNIRETFSTFRETKISLTNNSKIMIQNLIERYKEVKRQIGHSDEIYKYIAVQHFQQNWNINAEDFAEMLKFALSKHVNLIYNLAYTAINFVAKNKPVKQENCLNTCLMNQRICLKGLKLLVIKWISLLKRLIQNYRECRMKDLSVFT
jgi:hypothetical protein